MNPSAFVNMKMFPLTPNGKLDRKALPAPEGITRTEMFTAPRNMLEQQLLAIWQSVLKQKEISVFDNFFELGGHSLLATQLVYRIKEKIGLQTSLADFFMNPTIANLALVLNPETKSRINQVHMYLNDLKLCSEIPKIDKIPSTLRVKPKAILLTGATGFLGSYLLRELINETGAIIYCTVRPPLRVKAQDYLSKQLARFKLEALAHNNRVIAIEADLAKPKLGFSDKVFSELAAKIDSIYHCGALVHHIYDYSQLRASNVLSTLELLKLAARTKIKQMYFISTLSAVFDQDKSGKILEQFPIAIPEGTEGGYPVSKWVAEKLIANANFKGYPVTIYRPNLIMGDNQTGMIAAINNHFLLLLKGCLQLGYAPQDFGSIDIFPVNFIAKFIVKSSLLEENRGKVFNLTSPDRPTFSEVFEWLKDHGYLIQLIPYRKWQEKCASLDPANALYPLLGLYLTEYDMFANDIVINISSKSTSEMLARLDMRYPQIDKKLFILYFKYLEDWLKEEKGN